jgi:hypothetical protein
MEISMKKLSKKTPGINGMSSGMIKFANLMWLNYLCPHFNVCMEGRGEQIKFIRLA